MRDGQEPELGDGGMGRVRSEEGPENCLELRQWAVRWAGCSATESGAGQDPTGQSQGT